MAQEIWISHVEHEKKPGTQTDGPIKRVCASRYDAAGKQPVGKQSYTRAEIITLLQHYDLATRTYLNQLYTTTYNATRKVWEKGAKVVLTKDGKYITTEGNSTVQDNLGKLPLCDC